MVLGALLVTGQELHAQNGGLSGFVYDKDFEAPLPGATVTIVDTEQSATTSDQGNYLITEVPPGTYTVLINKSGYVRQVEEVLISAGVLTELDAWLAGEFTDMEEFVVQDILAAGAGTEAALLQLRIENPAIMDSISADLMSRAGAGDAASALRLVSGATVADDGKTAVIRGLPDRYVSSQMNGVRLPSADENKRAVQLDQFPSAVIESIQVSKTFTPDQQGDASGGAVDVRLKGIPDETILQFKVTGRHNDQVRGRSDFLGYHGGKRNVQPTGPNNEGLPWKGDVGVRREDADDYDYKWSGAAGGKMELDSDVTIGGFASIFYEKDVSFFDNGVDDNWWVTTPGGPMVPQTIQGFPQDGDFKTRLFDVDQSTVTRQYGGLATLGIETDRNYVGVTYLFTETEEDTTTLAEDTRGKEYFFPGYDPNDPMGDGNTPNTITAAPYIRTETLEYTERSTETLQLTGRHLLDMDEFQAGDFTFLEPELDWTLSRSSADLDQPDKRQFGSTWTAPSFNPGFPPFIPPFTTDPLHQGFKPAANFTLGNLQRIFKTIEEDSDQFSSNLKMPFEQWNGNQGSLKFGLFNDEVDREFDQDTFSNFGDNSSFVGGFNDFWSAAFPGEGDAHPISASLFDVDYDGEQDLFAWYSMVDMPLNDEWTLVGGVRFESTDISIVNDPEEFATWFPPGAGAPVELNPGDADVDFSQDDYLPSIGLEYRPTEQVTIRTSYSETVARQTFKELTPIIQQEFLGGPIFIGNPDLQMSALKNYDVRVDYRPYEGSLLSVSYFLKDIDDPIEYVQRDAGFSFTEPRNYPEGEVKGWEFEVRQDIGHFWDFAEGFSVGANATFIKSEVTLPDDENELFKAPNIQAPQGKRDMLNAPEHLYNLYTTYDIESTGTQITLFYTVKGDTLVAGAGTADGNFIPSVYQKEFETLNLNISQRWGERTTVQLQAKNITNPRIEEVYRDDVLQQDVTKTSFKRGRELSLGVAVRF